MTRDEFDQWLNHHTALFRGFDQWYLGLKPEEPQDIVEIRDEAWFTALKAYSVSQVKGATSRLLKLPSDQKPTSYTNHLGALLEILKRDGDLQYRQEYSRYAHRCGLCNDSGMVTVRCRDGFETLTVGGCPMRGKFFQAACKCFAGEPYKSREKNKLPVYHEGTMETLYEYRRARMRSSLEMVDEMRGSANPIVRMLAEKFSVAQSSPVRGRRVYQPAETF